MSAEIRRAGAMAPALLSLAVLLGGCGQEKPPELIKSAKSLIAKGDYPGASIQLKNALQQQEDGEARYLLAISLVKLGDLAGAESHLRRALEKQYSPDIVHGELAKVMLGQGKAEKLVAEFANVKVADPKSNALMLAVVGEANIALGKTEQAQQSFDSALALNPEELRARVGMARLVAARGDLPAATKMIEEILSKAPEHPQALSLQGELLVAQGKSDEASKTLATLIKVAPHNGMARFALVSLLISNGKFDEAAAGIAEMKKVLPSDARGKYLDALLAFRKAQPAVARDAVLQVLKVIPDHGPSLILAGAAEYQLGEFATAEMYLQKAITIYPDNLYARNLLVATHLRKGQPGKAEAALAYALKKTPNEPAVLRAAGEVAFANKRIAEAAKYYEQAIAGEKDNASLRTRLAQIRFAGGDTTRAMEELETASGLNSKEFQADLSLIVAHLSRKEYDKALRAVAALERKQPNNPLTYATKGTVFAAQKNLKDARASLEKALSLQFNYLPAARVLASLDLAEQNSAAARGRFDAILAKEPANEGALLSLSEVQMAANEPTKDVLATLERAIKANPTSPGARLALFQFHSRNQDAKAALVAAQEAISALPNNPQIINALGSAQIAAGEANLAVETFGKLVAAQPDASTPLMRTAAAQYAAKQFDAAIHTLRKVLAANPNAIDAQRQIVIALVAAQQTEEALRETKAVQKARPKEAVGFVLEGDTLASQKRFPEAAFAYSEGFKRQPIPELVIKQHQVLSLAGKSEEAKLVAEKWLKDKAGDFLVRLYLADVALRVKSYADAAKRYREVLDKNPENVQALNNLAWVLSEQNDPSALGYAEKAYAKAPASADVLDTYGWILLNRGETQRALDLLNRAVAAAPKTAEVRLHLAKALVKSGDKAAARREIERIMALVPEGPIRADAEKVSASL